MKMYNNGQRKGMMYGGGMTPRKPMMYGGMAKKKKKMNMGGLASENRKSSAGQAGMMNPMGSMTEKKKFSMGMAHGGKLHGKQAMLDKNKDGTISDKDFDIMRKK